MTYPTRETFLGLAEEGVYFPFLVETNPDLKPAFAFECLRGTAPGPAFLLESARLHEQTGRWSFVLAGPFMRFQSFRKRCRLRRKGYDRWTDGNPFEALRRLFRSFKMAPVKDLAPFLGGGVGLMNYELKNQIEQPTAEMEDPYGFPDIDLSFFDRGVVFDHLEGRCFIFLVQKCGSSPGRSFEEGRDAVRDWSRKVEASLSCVSTSCERPLFVGKIPWNGNEKRFKQMVSRAKQYIRMGDIFQANLSHCIEFHVSGDLFKLYQRETRLNPTCFAAYADLGDASILCASPERLIQLRGGVASTRPIAGTRPRSQDLSLDRHYSAELLLSPKERAEHVMLIDLERNDLGRVCEFGTVKVNEMMTVETYSHVRHIVSNITGRLCRDRDVFDLLQSVFPGGTITGAPKVRSMQIIDELEQRARGPYTGSLGYIGFDGNCDMNIVIRSLVRKNDKAYLQVGAGIVADSDPESEYRETLDKAQALLNVLSLEVPDIETAVLAA